MGKSDQIIFPEYLDMLNDVLRNQSISSIAFLGFQGENEFTNKIRGQSFILEPKVRHFYDLQLGNWDINSDWVLERKYDLIICTRAAYFSKQPNVFVQKCIDHLTPNGHALIDWGLGDHWRFPDYKVGWVRDSQHEYAYRPDNFLYSCYWDDSLLSDASVQLFWDWVKIREPYCYYDSLKTVILDEVPAIVNYNADRIRCVSLWKESPQLYIITLLKKSQYDK